MCVALPGVVLQTWDDDGIAMASVDFDGVIREVNLVYLPEATVGDAVIVHSGFAVRRSSPDRLPPTVLA